MAAPRRPSAIHDPDYQYMIQRMREAREEAGLTLKQVGEALGRPYTFVSKCELGERRIDPIDLQRFADLYGKPYEYFVPRRPRKRK